MTRLLALDFGEKRIGVAISDALGIIARPCQPIAGDNLSTAIKEIEAICQKEHVEKIIIGLPNNHYMNNFF